MFGPQAFFMNKQLRIKIIGAGATGSVLALNLANIGCNVTVYDKNSYGQIIRNKIPEGLSNLIMGGSSISTT